MGEAAKHVPSRDLRTIGIANSTRLVGVVGHDHGRRRLLRNGIAVEDNVFHNGSRCFGGIGIGFPFPRQLFGGN
jgi:hypothetical protein